MTRSDRVAMAATAAIVAVSLAARDARADDTVVTLVQPKAANALAIEATSRLAAELRAAGFVVRAVTSTGGDAREEVERADGSFATIAIVPTARGAVADVWIADRVTGKTLVRRVDVLDPARPNAASDLAIRSAELLRASLLEIHQHGRAPADLPAPIARFAGAAPPVSTRAPPVSTHAPLVSTRAPPVSTRAPPVSTRAPLASTRAARAETREPPARGLHASIEGAVALLASTEGGASLRPLLRLAIDLPRSISVRLAIAPSVAPTTLIAKHGTVAMRQTVASVDLAYTFLAPHARVRPLLSLGGGVFALQVAGDANPGFTSQRGQSASGLVSASAGIEVRIASGIRMLADTTVIALLPPQTVSALGEPLARLGRPAFLPSIGLVADLR